jgi:hypothetical protein
MSRQQFADIMQNLYQCKGKMTYNKFERVYNKYIKEQEVDQLKSIKSAYTMFMKAMTSFERKNEMCVSKK